MNEEFPMTHVDNRLLNHLLMEAAGPDPDTPPTFTPQEGYGEGTPSKEEMDYREEMLLLLGLLFVSIRDIQKGVGSGYNKAGRIEEAINDWMANAKQVLDRSLDSNHYAGVQEAERQLLAKGINPTGAVMRKAYYDIISQQHLNLESVGRELSDRLRNNLAIITSESNFKVPKSAKTQFNINNYFKRAQTRIDRMATYGSTAAFIEGQMAGYYDWQNVLLYEWETAGDKRVCKTCQMYASGGPYRMSQFPFIPHPGCRCRAVISERVPQDMGMFLPLALTTEELLEDYYQKE